MRQAQAILLKEFRQHWDQVAILLLVQTVLAWLYVKGSQGSENSVSVVEAVPDFLLLFMPISILLVCRRMFVTEYQSHTRDFLDSLPIQRWKMIAIKFVVALILLTIILLLLLALVLDAANDEQAVTGQFASILFMRGWGYVFCGLGFCFMVSFMGRFRNTLYYLALISLIAIEAISSLSLSEFGPLGLISRETMPYERHDMPWELFGQTTGFGILCCGVGLFLSLYGGGSLLRTLSGKLTLKEKSYLGIGFILFISLISTADLRRKKDPFDFVSEMVVRTEVGSVEVLYFEESEREAAEKLQKWLEGKMRSLEEEILGRKAPPLRVVLSKKLDGKTFDVSKVGEKDGVMWRCNYTSNEFDRTRFGGTVLHSVLNRHSRSMATYDPNHWFLDGFSNWWMKREQPDRWTEAAWLVQRHNLKATNIRSWSLLSDRFGTDHGESVGYSLVEHLERSHGEDAVFLVAKALYGRVPYWDVREAAYQWFNPIDDILLESTGSGYQEFLDGWERELSAADLEVPQFSADFIFEGDTLVYTLKFEKTPSESVNWSLNHVKVKPYDLLVNKENIHRVEHEWTSDDMEQSERLEDTYSSGQRVLFFLEVELPGLAYPLHLPSQRIEVP